MSKIVELLDLREKLDKWGEIMIKVWQENLDKQKIGASGELRDSFQKKVQGAQDEALGIALKFKMYGRFRDMQVHKGVKAYERNQNNANRIAATRYGAKVQYLASAKKRWYNRPKMSQIYKMSELMGINLGDAVSDELAQITNEINNTIIRY